MARKCPKCRKHVPGMKMMCDNCGTLMDSAGTGSSADTVRRQIRRFNVLSFVFGIPGLILQGVGQVMMYEKGPLPGYENYGVVAQVLGTILLIIGLGIYAEMKGRNFFWGLMGFLSLLLTMLPSSPDCVRSSI